MIENRGETTIQVIPHPTGNRRVRGKITYQSGNGLASHNVRTFQTDY